MFRKMLVFGVFMIAVFALAISIPAGAGADDSSIEGIVAIGEDGAVKLMADDGDYRVTGVDLTPEVGKWVTVTGTVVEEDDGPVIKAEGFTVNEEAPATEKEEESAKSGQEG